MYVYVCVYICMNIYIYMNKYFVLMRLLKRAKKAGSRISIVG